MKSIVETILKPVKRDYSTPRTVEATMKRRYGAYQNRKKVYALMQKMKNISIYKLAKKLEWDPAKTSYYVKQLEARGLVEVKPGINDGRPVKKVSIVDIKEMVSKLRQERPELFEPASSF